jgi:hypothetical protein
MESEASLLQQGRMPNLKPKQYIEYPQARDIAYFDLEGIAHDGKGHTFLIMGDGGLDVEDRQQPEMEQNPREGFFSRLMQQWKRRDNNVGDAPVDSPNQNRNISEINRAEVTSTIDVEREEKLESSRQSNYSRPQVDASQLPWIDIVSGRYSQSHTSSDQRSSDYLSWSRTTDPSRRMSPTNPINSSHSSAKLHPTVPR